jgi:hypothetical protein
MNIATRVLEIKLDYWIKKRKLTIDKMLDLENNAKDKEAKSLELVLEIRYYPASYFRSYRNYRWFK